MKFTEINLLGVYVAPMSVMMVAAWFITTWCVGAPPASVCCATSGTPRYSCSPST